MTTPPTPHVLSPEDQGAKVGPRALKLLRWCAGQFNSYGYVTEPEERDGAELPRWGMTLGTPPGIVDLYVGMAFEPDADGGTIQFLMEVVRRQEPERIYIGTGPWFPTAAAERAWRAFDGTVHYAYMRYAILAVVKATKCRRCGEQEFRCHHTQVEEDGKKCCRSCRHLVQLRRY